MTAAGGDPAPAGGMVHAGMHPPFSFRSWPKRKRAVHGPKEKAAFWRTPARSRLCADGGRRIGASADLALPSGTLWPSARSILPSRGGWCPGRRGARTHLICSSFRAFRFATRCPGHSQRLLRWLFAGALIDHRPAAAKRGAGCIPDFPGPKASPRAGRFRP